GPAVFATVLCTAATAFLFLEPRSHIAVASGEDLFAMLLFAIEGLLLGWLGESNLRRLGKLEQTTADLESRVEQRTAQLGAANRQLMTEVHERTQAEQRATLDRNFRAAILESLHDGIVACDAEGRLT